MRSLPVIRLGTKSVDSKQKRRILILLSICIIGNLFLVLFFSPAILDITMSFQQSTIIDVVPGFYTQGVSSENGELGISYWMDRSNRVAIYNNNDNLVFDQSIDPLSHMVAFNDRILVLLGNYSEVCMDSVGICTASLYFQNRLDMSIVEVPISYDYRDYDFLNNGTASFRLAETSLLRGNLFLLSYRFAKYLGNQTSVVISGMIQVNLKTFQIVRVEFPLDNRLLIFQTSNLYVSPPGYILVVFGETVDQFKYSLKIYHLSINLTLLSTEIKDYDCKRPCTRYHMGMVNGQITSFLHWYDQETFDPYLTVRRGNQESTIDLSDSLKQSNFPVVYTIGSRMAYLRYDGSRPMHHYYLMRENGNLDFAKIKTNPLNYTDFYLSFIPQNDNYVTVIRDYTDFPDSTIYEPEFVLNREYNNVVKLIELIEDLRGLPFIIFNSILVVIVLRLRKSNDLSNSSKPEDLLYPDVN